MRPVREGNDGAGAGTESLRQELKDWLHNKRLVAVDFTEDNDPVYAPTDDYRLVYIARFVPKDANQASMEIHLSDEGRIGIGIETRQRIADRLKVNNQSQGFADGFEPRNSDIDEILRLLDLSGQCDGDGEDNSFLRARRHEGLADIRARQCWHCPIQEAQSVEVPA
ncbi:MAG: hypothetical protein WBP79_08295 [Candidatus Acidiferrales bacterium]